MSNTPMSDTQILEKAIQKALDEVEEQPHE